MLAAPPLALAASPARVALVAPASRTVDVRNAGAAALVVSVGVPGRLLTVRPQHFLLPARAKAVLTLRVRRGSGARPGDHEWLVLLNARPRAAGRIAVRLRLAVRVHARFPGRIVRAVEIGALRVHVHRHKRMLLLPLANRGNVTEQLAGRVTVTLFRERRPVSRLRPRARGELLPGAHTLVAFPYAGGARGRVNAVVKVRLGAGLPPVVRRFRIRL